MKWGTVYIAGKINFEREVIDQLVSSDFPFMEGSIDERGLLLIWVNENAQLNEIKKAIGAKIVFKYRLKFYRSLEEFDSQSTKGNILKFTPTEEAMVKKMNDWEDQFYSRHSA